MSKAKIFLYSNLAFIFSIAFASFLPAPFLRHDLWFFSAAVSLSAIIILLKLSGRGVKYRVSIFFILFLLLGLWRYSLIVPVNAPDKIWFYNGQTVLLSGTVSREPEVREKNLKLTIAVDSIKISNNTLPVQGNVLITTNLYPRYQYGDNLNVKCELQAPEPIEEFAYDRYLARFHIFSVCYYPALTPNPSPNRKGTAEVLYSKILNLKAKLGETINLGLPEPESALLQGILLGARQNLPQELLNTFARAGITHIIAISGTNIVIMSTILMSALFYLGFSRRRAFFCTVILLVGYLILIGLPASAVRAGVMAFIALLALQIGRLNKAANSVLLAACIMLLINPKMLRDDTGWQLSFLAVLGLMYLYPLFDQWLEKWRVPEKFSVRETLALTLAAQVFTFPIIALDFHQVSLVAPLVNIAVLFLFPFIMVGGFLAAFISLLTPALAWLWFAPIYFALKYIIWVAANLVKLPFAYIEIEYLWIGWTGLYYLLAILSIWWYNKNVKNCG